MGLYFLEKKCHRISEISFLPSLKAKLLFPVCDGIPCTGIRRWRLLRILDYYMALEWTVDVELHLDHRHIFL